MLHFSHQSKLRRHSKDKDHTGIAQSHLLDQHILAKMAKLTEELAAALLAKVRLIPEPCQTATTKRSSNHPWELLNGSQTGDNSAPSFQS
jgi:hypothetical protein